MKKIEQLRTEKQLLESYSDSCRMYITQIQQRVTELGASYKSGRITNDEYHYLINHGLSGKSYREYLILYKDLLRKYEQRIEDINAKLIEQATSTKKKRGVAISAILICVLLIIPLILLYQSNMTGNVIYSVVQTNTDAVHLTFNGSTTISWIPPKSGRLTTFMLTGETKGNGYDRIYLESNGATYLVYATDRASKFENVCGGACYLTTGNSSMYHIRIELENGTSARINAINYLVSDLQEFSVEPRTANYTITENRYITGKFIIHNPRNLNMSIAIYAEGELSAYTTINSSYYQFSENDTVSSVYYTLDLPFTIEPKQYTEYIVVRYLPKGSFTGEAPIEKHEIIVQAQAATTSKPSPYNRNGIFVTLVITLLCIILVNVIIFIRRRTRR